MVDTITNVGPTVEMFEEERLSSEQGEICFGMVSALAANHIDDGKSLPAGAIGVPCLL